MVVALLLSQLQFKACTWLSFLCTWNKCAPLAELSAVVQSYRSVAENITDPNSYALYSSTRAIRYLVVSTVQTDNKFKFIWSETELLPLLLSLINGDNGTLHPIIVSLVVDCTMWLIRNCSKNGKHCSLLILSLRLCLRKNLLFGGVPCKRFYKIIF